MSDIRVWVNGISGPPASPWNTRSFTITALIGRYDEDSALAQVDRSVVAKYPKQTKVTLQTLPTQPTMPNPCVGVPANPWCRAKKA